MDHDQEVLNELLALARTNTRSLDSNSREVLKKQKSKKENYSSRLGEEPEGFDFVSSWPAGANHSPQEAVVSIKPAAITSSRAITGITAQQVKTDKGIKVSISIQTPDDLINGSFASLTAELKRHGRLRELKRYSGDSSAFEEHYIKTIQELKDLTPEQGRTWCCGRIHERGKRSAWFADMMVVGCLDSTGTYLTSIILWYGTEEYQVDMTEELTERQTVGYHCSGIYGEIVKGTQVPTLATAKRRTF